MAYPVSYSQRSEISLPRGRSGRSVGLISLHLVPSSRMSGTPPYSFAARTGVTLHLPFSCVLHGHHNMATAAVCPHSALYMLHGHHNMATAAVCPHSASYMLDAHVFRCCSVVPSPFGTTVVPLQGSQPTHSSDLWTVCLMQYIL